MGTGGATGSTDVGGDPGICGKTGKCPQMFCLGCFPLSLNVWPCARVPQLISSGQYTLMVPQFSLPPSIRRQVCIGQCFFFQLRTSSTCCARDSRVCKSLGVKRVFAILLSHFFVAFVFFFGFALIAVIVTCSLFSDFSQCQQLPTSTLESSSPFAKFQSQEMFHGLNQNSASVTHRPLPKYW